MSLIANFTLVKNRGFLTRGERLASRPTCVTRCKQSLTRVETNSGGIGIEKIERQIFSM
jgi:hypothetical protein